MPRYWLTIHWPHPTNEAEDHPWFIYLQHRYKSKGDRISPNDSVVFYETATGRPHHRQNSSDPVPLLRGRQAVVGLATVADPIRPSTTGHSLRTYPGGQTLNWAWEIPCTNHHWGRPVPYPDVLTILNRGTIRIPSGLLEISQSQFEQFRKALQTL